jgi:hypothetical protein
MAVLLFAINQALSTVRTLRAMLIATCLGAIAGAALAQVGPPGTLDSACLSACAARGYEAEFCNRVCVVPQPSEIPADVAIDWECVTSCRNRGGTLGDCLPRCQRR